MVKNKIEPLVIGQRVWVESRSLYFKEERTIREYEVIKVNRSSAYIASVVNIEKHRSEGKDLSEIFTLRVNQKTHQIKSIFVGYAEFFWITKEAFEKSVKNQKERAELLKQAQEKVKNMSLRQLREFMGVH